MDDNNLNTFPPFSETHNMFRKLAQDFVEKEIIPNIETWEEDGEIPRSIFEKCGELGFLGIRFSKDYGGQALDFWYSAILIEELVKSGSLGVCVSLMAHCEFASSMIEKYGTPKLKEDFLTPAIKGKRIGALGLTEPAVGSDLANLSTKAVKKDGCYVISGQKTFITNGKIGDFMTTAVRTSDNGINGLSLVIIPTDIKGYSANRLRKVGAHTTDTAEVFLDNVEIPVDYLIGKKNCGFQYILDGFVAERLVLSVICYTQMDNMLKEAIKYGRERECFGKHLLKYQSWQHRLADVKTTIEASKALTYMAINKFVRGEQCSQEASMAKLFAAESAPSVAHITKQIFGGYGFMDEFKIARLVKDSLALSIGAGTSEMMRNIIAKSL